MPTHQQDAFGARGPAIAATPPPPVKSPPKTAGTAGAAAAPAQSSPDAIPVEETCGDGVVGEGETCDGDCPDACDDANPCSEDVLKGKAKSCNARCETRPITGVTDDGTCCKNGAVASAKMCDAPDTMMPVQMRPTPPSSLVHRYSFDGMGAVLEDSVGDADGKFVGGMLVNDGKLTLAGMPGQYGSLPAGSISALSSATIEVWLILTVPDTAARVFDFGNRTGGAASAKAETFWALSARSFLNGNPITVVNFTPGADGSGDQYATANRPFGPSTQHCVTAVFDAEARSLRLYMDGELAGDTRVTGSLADIEDQQLWLGRALDDSYPGLNAVIDELRIYDVALDATAIGADCSAGPDALPNAK